jgi:hypothetical protein
LQREELPDQPEVNQYPQQQQQTRQQQQQAAVEIKEQEERERWHELKSQEGETKPKKPPQNP